MALVQLSGGASTTGSNAVLTFAAPLTAGSASIVVCASWDGGTGLGLASVTGSVNGAYTRAAINPATANFVEVWYRLGVAAGSETITLTSTAADGNRYQTARAMEWSGVEALEAASGATPISRNTLGDDWYVRARFSNSTANNLVVGGFAWNSGIAPAVWNIYPDETMLWSEADPSSFTAAALVYKTVSVIETSQSRLLDTTVPNYPDIVGAVATFRLSAAPVAHVLEVEPAAHVITAADVTLSVKRALSFNAVSYALTAAAITLQVKRRLNIDAASYTLDAPAVALSVASGPAARVLDIEPADYALTAADVALQVSGTPPEPTPSSGNGFVMSGVPVVSIKPLLQRILEERAERTKPATRRIAKRTRTVEIEAAKVALQDGGEEQFRALMQRWLDQMQGLQNVADSEAYRVFMANVAYRINQLREAAEAFDRQQQDDEDALIALLM